MKIPLAERIRPKDLQDWVGQCSIFGPGSLLREAVQKDQLFSFVLYAPPGTGKTTLCRMIKAHTKNRFFQMNAVTAGVKDLRAVIDEAKAWKDRQSVGSVLFIDEIHRFNKSQQDALLAAVEAGEIILIGATTENPSFELNSALLSRLRVFRMEALGQQELLEILDRGFKILSEESSVLLEDGALELIARLSQGDARMALNALENLGTNINHQNIAQYFEKAALKHDKTGDLHHQIVSAFIKSMRAGESDAALYYLARLWEAGEDPKYIARRMLIFASEDVGNADLRAIALCNAVRQAVEFIGRPECFYALSQGVLYLSRAAKSREAGDQFMKAQKKARAFGPVAPPKFLMNAVTPLDRELGRGSPKKPNEGFLPKEVEKSLFD